MVQGGVLRPDAQRRRRRLLDLSDQEQFTAPSNILSATGTNNANYYNGDYTDPTNYLTPVGAFADSPGPYGTYDMGGDVWQWNEANSRALTTVGCVAGRSSTTRTTWPRPPGTATVPTVEYNGVGFRVASEAFLSPVASPCSLRARLPV